MSGGDGMDSILECVLSDMRGFLLLRPFMLDAYDRCYLRPEVGGAYPQWKAPRHI
jgi:hypothetical protein